MQNKKVFLIVGLLVVLVGAAAFIGGRLLNQKVGPLGLAGLGGPIGGGDAMSISVKVIPAPELPTTQPEVMGMFIERQDNTILVSSISLESGSGGGVAAGSPADLNSGPKVEVVVTGETTIYRETTEISGPPSGENQSVQQTVEETTLDDLNSQSMVSVWGRRSGDRIIAEVLFYSNPMVFQRP
jgi:hypothetical protein